MFLQGILTMRQHALPTTALASWYATWKTRVLWVGLLAGLLGTGTWAQTTTAMVVKRDTQLRSTPSDTASGPALPEKTAVIRLSERQGPWLRVQNSAGQAGWVHMFDLQSGSTSMASAAGTGALRTLGQTVNNNRAGSNSVVATATAGIRGLDASDIAKAQPNPQEVAKAETLRATEEAARQFATRSGLLAQNVPTLTKPAPPTNN
jgi:hypothetical protein